MYRIARSGFSTSCLALALAASLAVLLAVAAQPRFAAAHLDADATPAAPASSSFAAAALAPDVDPERALEELSYAPGRLVLKLAAPADACLDCQFAGGRSLAPAGRSSGLDELGRRFGLRKVRALRRADASAGSAAERRSLQAARHARQAEAAGARGRASAIERAPDMTSVYVLELSPWLDMEAVAREYARDPAVAWAEPDRKVHVAFTPNDPYLASTGSWGQPFDDLWGVKLIDAPTAWEVARGSGVVVAVTDTGLDATHPDIAANIWSNPGEVAGDGIDNEGNGYVDDVAGWDFANDDADPFDDHGHGTHVSGTIAAAGDNGTGIVGVAWQARIMALKGLDAGGSGYESDLAAAIVYAAENGADVINASWGGVGSSQVIDDAIEIAHAAGAVFVAAAGNSDLDVTDSPYGPFFPAANRRAIAVSAFDHLDQRAGFSNFGTKIDVAAPGGGDDGDGFDPFRSILSLRSSGAGDSMTGAGRLVVGASYLRQAGTSMAAPHVAGVAALVLSLHPAYTPVQVRQALRAGSDDVGDPGFDIESGYGRVDAASAVGLAALSAAIDSPGPGAVVMGNSLAISGSAAGDGFASYTLEYGAGSLPSSWTPIAGPIATPVASGELALWDLSGVPDGTYVVRLRVLNTSGATFEDRVAIVLDHVVLTSPEENAMIRPAGPLEVRGTAAGGSFTGFHVEWRVTTPDYVTGPWRSDGVALAGGGSAPVVDGLLATFDTAAITQNTHVDFRVVVEQGAAQAAEEHRNIVLDPTLRAGWPQRIAGLPQFDSSSRLLHHVTIADLDADGTKEILAAYGDLVYVWRNDGTLMPGWPKTLDAAAGPVYMRRSPAAADLDGDGELEVVVSDNPPATNASLYQNNEIYVWHHDGAPMAGWPKAVRRAYSLNPDDPYFLGGGPRGDFVLADVDGDGRRDIVAVIGPALFVIDVDGNVLPGWPQTFPTPWPCLLNQECFEPAVAVGDVDGDGRKEIAAVTAGSPKNADDPGQTILLYAANGALMPGFPRKLTRLHWGPTVSYPMYFNTPTLADIDGDGDLEILAMTNTMKLAAYHHTGRRASLRPGKAVGTGNRQCVSGAGGGVVTIPPMLQPPTAGDLDGDGVAEVVVSTHTKPWMWRPQGRNSILWTWCPSPVRGPDWINVLRGPGQSGLPGWPVAIDYPAGDNAYGPGPVAIGDIDGDLRPELVSGSGICGIWDTSRGLAGHICFPVNAYHASGALLPGFPKSVPFPGPTNGVTPAIGDLDGDGRKEIVWVDFGGDVLVWDVPGTPAPEAMQWPMFRHDPAHTGALVANP